MIGQIPIVFCFDNKFSQYAAVSIFSILLSTVVPIKIYCIVPSCDVDKLSFIQQMNKVLNSNITVIGADDQKFSKWKTMQHITQSTYLRLLIPGLIDENKIIYLDSDLIVLSDLSELYATLRDQFFLAGVFDPVGAKLSKIPRAKDDVYINAGVLVMNLESLRQDGFIDKCAKIYSSHHQLVTFPSQCLINKYAEKQKINIDAKWNRMVYGRAVNRKHWNYSISNNNSSIIHFIGPLKPWNEWCNPDIADFWWEYANKLATRLGRSVSRQTALPNQLCRCGSGERFKYCHGAFFDERDLA